MRVLGKLDFSFEAVGSEVGGILKNGKYNIVVDSVDHHHSTTYQLAKDDANISIPMGGITTAKFIHVKAVFADDTVNNADIELIVNDGGGDKTLTGTQFVLSNTDITSIKITNNSHDTTGSAAKVFLDIAGD